ncbi:hypothetical protein [Ornithinimicrobium murale]|uniref:hypothetical protein n=1 Tax=Ornithinimicrobium murale TaxID=1050153 RepID=UPI00192D2E4C|nr:hypothetical protein [Ornithinimicrobium murale]
MDRGTVGTGGLTITIGGGTRSDLLGALSRAGVQLNVHAETLLADPAFDAPLEQTLTVVERTVAELDLPQGAVQSRVFAAALAQGLQLCPLITGPWLRLALLDQATAPDSVLSAGRAPSGAIHIASASVNEDVEHPKGFYLRVVDGVPWLRGYRCDDTYIWPAEQRLAFVLAAGPDSRRCAATGTVAR